MKTLFYIFAAVVTTLTACAPKPEEATYGKTRNPASASSSTSTSLPLTIGPSPTIDLTPTFVQTQAEESFARKVWNIYFYETVLPTSTEIVALTRDLRYNGCVTMVSNLVLNNYKRQPWNSMVYVAGVQGVGAGNTSYNHGFMTVSYKTIFGFDQSPESIDYWLPLINNGTLDALGITNSFLSDKGSMQERCDKEGFK